MQWVQNGSRLGYQRSCSGYVMGHAWVTEDAVGREWSRLSYQGSCSECRMGHAWVTEDHAVGTEWVTPGLPRIMQWVRNGSCLGH